MTAEGSPGATTQDLIRRAIGGDPEARRWIAEHAGSNDDPAVLVMAALLEADTALLDRARRVAATSRQRQEIEIALAHLRGSDQQVDALARDHLVDHPDNLLVAWIATRSAARPPGGGRA